MEVATLSERHAPHRRGLRLEYFTISWNVIEAVQAADRAAARQPRVAGRRSRNVAGALLMLPVIVWQGWETLEEAREENDDG